MCTYLHVQYGVLTEESLARRLLAIGQEGGFAKNGLKILCFKVGERGTVSQGKGG